MKYYVILSEAADILALYSTEPGYLAPPEDAVPVPDDVGEALRTQGLTGKRFVNGELQNAPPPPPPLAAWRTATLSKARSMRLPIMQVLDGMQASALVNGTTVVDAGQTVPLAAAIEARKQALRVLPQQVDLGAATTQQQMEYIVVLAYKAIVDAAPAEIKTAFDSLKP